jgi:hypothetical protein
MAAETLTGTRGGTAFPVAGHGSGGNLKAWHGGYSIPAAVEDGDIFELFRVPAGAVILGGWLQADDMDTGIEALDMDLGWAANGVDSADPDGFGNFGTWTGDAVTDIKPETGIYMPLGGVLFTAGPKLFTVETLIQLEANTAATTFAAGQVYVTMLGVVDAAWAL